MKKLFFILVLGVLAFAGCQTTTPRKNQVQNIEHKNIALNDEQVLSKAIIKGAIRRKWEITESAQGIIKAELNIRSHWVKVEILYGKDYYAILYNDSKNLGYKEKSQTIHPNYNRWIKYLERSINTAIAESL